MDNCLVRPDDFVSRTPHPKKELRVFGTRQLKPLVKSSHMIEDGSTNQDIPRRAKLHRFARLIFRPLEETASPDPTGNARPVSRPGWPGDNICVESGLSF